MAQLYDLSDAARDLVRICKGPHAKLNGQR